MAEASDSRYAPTAQRQNPYFPAPHDDRRLNLRGAFAVPAAGTVASAEDLHVEWWAEAERLNSAAEACDDARATELAHRIGQLHCLCVTTPAHTLEGMAVVINMVSLKEQVGAPLDQSDREAMLRVAAALQRAARRACQ